MASSIWNQCWRRIDSYVKKHKEFDCALLAKSFESGLLKRSQRCDGAAPSLGADPSAADDDGQAALHATHLLAP